MHNSAKTNEVIVVAEQQDIASEGAESMKQFDDVNQNYKEGFPTEIEFNANWLR